LADLRRRSKSAPVLLLTSSDEPADRVKGLDAGADDCLVSPFALSELGARLRALVRRSAVSPQTVINIGDLSINKNSRTVTLNGNPVGLTAKEYALLELLAVNRNELVTRSMIYQHVFDEYDPSVANSVDVYISKIRQKIGRSFIKTCRGQGYIID
jgi:two-component system OmpR family response regulator